MPHTEFAPEKSRNRRWRALPPIPAGWESLSGLGVLEEVPGELGGLLWRSLRTVLLWAQVPTRKRSGLFLPGTEEARLADLLCLFPAEPALEAPLATLAEVLGAPTQVDPRRVALACTRIAYWAQNQGARQTQWEFAHAASLACPSDPRSALALARAHRDRGAYAISEAWYRRAVSLARQGEDAETYARGYIGLGKMWIARGSFPKARKSLLKALRTAAKDEELREIEGMAAHDLFTVESDCNQDAAALDYAEAALRCYGVGHRLLASLANDIAYFWIQRGRFKEALPIFRAVVPHLGAEHTMKGQGNLARAAGAVGDLVSYRAAHQCVCDADDKCVGKADALAETAQAAVSLALYQEAAQLAARAIEIARARGEARTMFVAESVFAAAQNEQASQKQSGLPDSVWSDTEFSFDIGVEPLVSSVVACLEASL